MLVAFHVTVDLAFLRLPLASRDCYCGPLLYSHSVSLLVLVDWIISPSHPIMISTSSPLTDRLSPVNSHSDVSCHPSSSISTSTTASLHSSMDSLSMGMECYTDDYSPFSFLSSCSAAEDLCATQLLNDYYGIVKLVENKEEEEKKENRLNELYCLLHEREFQSNQINWEETFNHCSITTNTLIV